MAKRQSTIDDDLFASAPTPQQSKAKKSRSKRGHTEPATRQEEAVPPKPTKVATKPLTTHVPVDLKQKLDEIAKREGWTAHSMRIYALHLFCDLYWKGDVPDAKKAIRRGRETIRYSGGE